MPDFDAYLKMPTGRAYLGVISASNEKSAKSIAAQAYNVDSLDVEITSYKGLALAKPYGW